LISLIAMTVAVPARAADGLVVHEWGTFTAVQDERGEALPGINIDDEPLPDFCHNLCPWVSSRANALPVNMKKGVPQRHPYVSLRLETPVLYFHPGKDDKLPFSIDVNVQFRGGWLTEFYPQAEPDAPGLQENQFNFGMITRETVGRLTWRNVQVGTPGDGPKTEENVWLAPRDVRAATVTVGPQTSNDSESETERFLFYRGVANRAVPLRVDFDLPNHQLAIRGQCADVLAAGQSARIANLWVVDIRPDSAVAWRTMEPLTVTNEVSSVLATTSGEFAANDYSAANLESLRAKMHEAMVAGGLFDDEATAMLNTWKRAYFQSPGLRVFFLVPRVWTDSVLPLKLSRPATIERVMMGRIELISPGQRELLRKLAATRVSDPNWISKIQDSSNARKFWQGRGNFGDLGVVIPQDYQIYLDLGRFRNALVLAEQRARPTDNLNQFINIYGLAADQTP
jgi:hypothetical protein